MRKCETCPRSAAEERALCPGCHAHLILGSNLLREIAGKAEAAKADGKRWRGPAPARYRRLAAYIDRVEEAVP